MTDAIYNRDTIVEIDNREDEGIMDVTVTGVIDPTRTVGFMFDEVLNVIHVEIEKDDGTSVALAIDADAFFITAAALTRENVTAELESLTENV